MADSNTLTSLTSVFPQERVSMTTGNPRTLVSTPNVAPITFLLDAAGLHSDNSIFIPTCIPPSITGLRGLQGQEPPHSGSAWHLLTAGHPQTC